MGIGIKLSGGGGGGGGPASVIKVADAVARLALTGVEGMLVLQLDNNILYEYDGPTTSWLELADPARPGVYRVADAAALAALTVMVDGDMALQLDTDELYEYRLATTDWIKIGGAGTVSTYSGYDPTTGEVISVPGVSFINTATQYIGAYINKAQVATLTDIKGIQVQGDLDGQTATDFKGFQSETNIGFGASATVVNQGTGFISNGTLGALVTMNGWNTFSDGMYILAGASVTDYASFSMFGQINQATMNQLAVFRTNANIGNTDPTHINGYRGVGIFDVFGADADVDQATGIDVSPLVQTGAVMDGFVGFNLNLQADTTMTGFRGIEINANFGQNSATSVNNHIDFQAHPTYRLNATLSSYNGISIGPSFEEGSTINTATGIYHNMDLRGTITGPVTGYASNNNLGNGTAPVALTSYTDMNLNPHFAANLTLDDYFGFVMSPNVTAGASITNNVQLMRLAINSAVPVGGTAQGLQIDMTNFQTAAQPNGINVTVGTSQLSALFDTGIYSVQSPGGPYGLNNFGGQLHIAAGFPITAANFGIGNNLGISIFAEDDIPVDSSGLRLGFLMNGFLTQVGIAAGKTVDSITFMGAGAQDAVPGGSTGTFSEMIFFRALGILPTNGATITDMYGFRVDATLTAASPTNAWGFYCADTTAENYLGKSLAIGTANFKVSNADVALEIGSLKALRHAKLTTVQRDALTALDAMEIYNTDTDQLEYYNGTTWEVVGDKLVVQTNSALTDAVDFDPPNKRRQVCQVSGNGGPVSQTDIDITDAQEGDELMLIGTDDDDTVTFVSATNTILNGSCTLAANDTLTLIFVNGKYREFARNN